jgi:hypothetical protein
MSAAYGLRTVFETRLMEELDTCYLISGQLHGPSPCFCRTCCALETTVSEIIPLLRPGETRQITAKGTDLFLRVKRHDLEKSQPKRQPASVPRLAPKRAPKSRPGVQPAFLDSVRSSFWYR